MRRARYPDEIDAELALLNKRHNEAIEIIWAQMMLVAGIEARADVLLDRRLLLTADA